jgi:hypothetical protein
VAGIFGVGDSVKMLLLTLAIYYLYGWVLLWVDTKLIPGKAKPLIS